MTNPQTPAKSVGHYGNAQTFLIGTTITVTVVGHANSESPLIGKSHSLGVILTKGANCCDEDVQYRPCQRPFSVPLCLYLSVSPSCISTSAMSKRTAPQQSFGLLVNDDDGGNAKRACYSRDTAGDEPTSLLDVLDLVFW